MNSWKASASNQGKSVMRRFFTPLLAAPMLTVIFAPTTSHAISGWSEKYKVNCQTCHAPTFARLNYDGERFLWNGYQSPDDSVPDGDKVGKKKYGNNLALEKDVRNWLMARLSINPIQVTTNNKVVNGNDTVTRVDVGTTPWLQLFVAGSISKNISIYIENEFSETSFHQAWYYLGFHNLFDSKLLNLQMGRLSPVLFMPFPDRLPQLPGLVGKPGVMRVKSSNGAGLASVDLRSPRYGVQYYGYKGPAIVFGGLAPNSSTGTYPGQNTDLGYWLGGRIFTPEVQGTSFLAKLDGSSIGYEYMTGTDIRNTDTTTKKNKPYFNTNSENNWQRHIIGANLRWAEKLDIQGSYVIGIEDNWKLDTANTAKKSINFQGSRILGNYFLGDHWAAGGQWDHYWSDNSSLLAEEKWLYFPVITYLPKENVRISIYPGYDLRDVADNLKKHEILTNIRVGF